MGGERERHLAGRPREEDAPRSEAVHRGRSRQGISVGAQSIRPHGVDRDEDDGRPSGFPGAAEPALEPEEKEADTEASSPEADGDSIKATSRQPD